MRTRSLSTCSCEMMVSMNKLLEGLFMLEGEMMISATSVNKLSEGLFMVEGEMMTSATFRQSSVPKQ